MNNKTWYKRLLVSHFAVLLLTGAVISVIVVAVTAGNLIQENDKASRNYADRVVDGMTTALKNIEWMLASQIVGNEAIRDYFGDGADEPKLVNYRASGELAKIRNNSLIHSIYFYRYRDRTVLTHHYAVKLDEFPDRAFVRGLLDRPRDARWSPIRPYTEFPLIDPPENVISIAKNAGGNEGIVVLNVRADMLLSMAGKLGVGTGAYLHIADGQGRILYTTDPAALAAEPAALLTSDYIGWRFASGTARERLIVQAAQHSLMPLAAIMLSLAVIVGIIIHATRRNYRPLEHIVLRVLPYREDGEAGSVDEFALIEDAFDSMLIRQQAEKQMAGRKRFFAELKEEKPHSAQEWQEYARLFGIAEGDGLVVAVMEIDKYVLLLERDRHKLFASRRRLDEAAERWTGSGAETAGLDWIAGDRLALVIRVGPGGGDGTRAAGDMLDKLREWAADELPFSLTIGVGSAVAGPADSRTSYREALTALQYKMTAGNNRVIDYRDMKDKENGVDARFFRWMEDMIYHFRMPSPEWKVHFARIFDHLEERMPKNEEMLLHLNYLTRRFAAEMEELSPDVNAYWRGTAFPQMTGALRELGAAAEIRTLYDSLLGKLHDQYIAVLASDGGARLVHDIKKYIEDHYANPDLSLNHISEQFGINGKYASQLFKEAFRIKFVDFLIGLRIRRAQQLLRETELTVGEVSRLVGYEHAISFGRIFKKTVGLSPGDYRRRMQRLDMREEL